MMIKVQIRNREILQLLDQYIDWFFEQDTNSLPISCNDMTVEQIDEQVSDQYRQVVEQDPNHVGYPLKARAVDLNGLADERNSKWREKIHEFSFEFKRQLGAKHDALHMYYPENGFIGWHTNENAAGKNLILSYSSDGLGFFKYLDPDTNEIITIPDEKGWNAKMSEFGRSHSTRIWHCARNYGPRLTISYIIQNEAMWEDVKEELEEE